MEDRFYFDGRMDLQAGTAGRRRDVMRLRLHLRLAAELSGVAVQDAGAGPAAKEQSYLARLELQRLLNSMEAALIGKPQRRKCECVDCRAKRPAYFFLHSRVWRQVAEYDELLCLDCFERRLGRKVTLDDCNEAMRQDVEMPLRIVENSKRVAAKAIGD